MTDAATLHAEAIVIDATCPLANLERCVDWWREGGTTVIAPTIVGIDGNARTGFAQMGRWQRYLRQHGDTTLLVLRAGDVERARTEGRLGLILHCQGTALIEDEVDLLDAYHAAGLRIVQLCYNTKNLIGDGAGERTDSGLSHFGLRVVKRLNDLRLIVDCAHTGHRTSLDAVEHSSAPVIISHANARAVHDNARNIDDDLIRAIAASGGVIGTVGFPGFLESAGQPTLDRFIDDIAYKADLVGIEHVGLGIDYYQGQHPVADDADAALKYETLLAQGLWRASEYPPPPWRYPEGIETPRTLPVLTARLLERGFAEDDVRRILGLNWLRVYRAVWGD